MIYKAECLGGYNFKFPRITVVLGANGSGKSTLLRGIKENQNSVYVEGGRTITINDTISLTRQNFQEYQTYGKTLDQFKKKRKSRLVDRIFNAIMVLIQQEQVLKDSHSDAVTNWDRNGRVGEVPVRDQPPLEALFEQYSEVFPHLHLNYNKNTGSLTVYNNESESTYGPSALSDGEKQVFSLLADLMQLEEEYGIVVVDEPELNLHPELAERLWSLLESEYQDKRFLYATHSIQFALRPQVDALFILSRDPSKIRKIENISELSRSDLELFLGGVPGILNASKVIVTEGHEKSFDSVFYRWLLGDSKIEVFPCGGCEDVKQVVNKAGLWAQVSSDISLAGVVDSDFRRNKVFPSPRENKIVQLELHEAESYICIPDIVVAAANKIGSQEPIIQKDEVEQIILSTLKSQRLGIALRRCFSESHHTARMSLERSDLSTLTSKDDAMELIKNKAGEEVNKAVKAMDETVFKQCLENELDKIDQTIGEKNVLGALKYLPGKELLAKVAPRTGCKNGTDLMRSINRNLEIKDFEIIEALSHQLQAVHEDTSASAESS